MRGLRVRSREKGALVVRVWGTESDGRGTSANPELKSSRGVAAWAAGLGGAAGGKWCGWAGS
jgi:hypothetical protein